MEKILNLKSFQSVKTVDLSILIKHQTHSLQK
jgi:hypothetical protein